jgi:hypothetical protein
MVNLYECPRPKCGLYEGETDKCPACGRANAVLLQTDIRTKHLLERHPLGAIISRNIGLEAKEVPILVSRFACDPTAKKVKVRVTNNPSDVNCPKCLEAINGS